MIELEVRHVRMPLHDALPAVAVLGPRGQAHAPTLSVAVGAEDAHALLGAMRGMHGRNGLAALLARWIGRGGHAAVVRLIPAGQDLPTSEQAAREQCGLVDVPLEPGAALAAAVRLGLRVLGDPRLFSADDALEGTGLVAFLAASELELFR